VVRRRKLIANAQNPEDKTQTVFSEEGLSLANNSRVIRIEHTDGSGKRILVFVWEDREYLLISRISCFLHGTFKNCPRQFALLYSLHVDVGRALHENYIYPVVCTLLLDKL